MNPKIDKFNRINSLIDKINKISYEQNKILTTIDINKKAIQSYKKHKNNYKKLDKQQTAPEYAYRKEKPVYRENIQYYEDNPNFYRGDTRDYVERREAYGCNITRDRHEYNNMSKQIQDINSNQENLFLLINKLVENNNVFKKNSMNSSINNHNIEEQIKRKIEKAENQQQQLLFDLKDDFNHNNLNTKVGHSDQDLVLMLDKLDKIIEKKEQELNNILFLSK